LIVKIYRADKKNENLFKWWNQHAHEIKFPSENKKKETLGSETSQYQ